MSDALAAWRTGVDGAWDHAAAAHLLRRAGFGAKPGEIECALQRGFDATLAELFEPRGHDAMLFASIDALLAADSLDALQSWWLALMLEGGDPLRERVALMWHNHFATSHAKVADVRMMHAQNRLFREHGLGDFRELLHAIAIDPAMLVWLDGDDNKAGEPNENFAREVLELFALGRGNYGEGDIRELARALTGSGTRGRAYAFTRDLHDAGEKQIFGVRGRFDARGALDVVLAQPACPRHVARRLVAEFVAVEVDARVVDELARVLVEANWSIAATIERLLRSRLFFAASSRRSRIAAPVELTVATARRLGARVAPAKLASAAARMGQALFRPPTVKGWDGGRAWINASAWLARHNTLSELVAAKNDLAAALGAPARKEVASRAIELLLDGAATDDYARRLRDLSDSATSDADALKNVTTAIVTSPEYHFA